MPSESLGRVAEFAATFSDTTNLAQRKRYQDTINQYHDEAASEAKGQYERQLTRAQLKDPLKAEQLKLGQRREGRMAEFAAKRAAIDQETLDLNENKLLLAQDQELRQKQMANRIQIQSNNVDKGITELLDQEIFPGTAEYAQNAMTLLLKNPHVPPEMRKQILKDAQVDINPEYFFRLRDKMKNGLLTFSETPNGVSVSVRETVPKEPKITDTEKEKAALEVRHERLLKMQKEAQILHPESADYYKKEAASVFEKMKNVGAPTHGNRAVMGDLKTTEQGLNSETAPVTHDPDTAASGKFVVGKKYRDANGNLATYIAPGQWKPD